MAKTYRRRMHGTRCRLPTVRSTCVGATQLAAVPERCGQTDQQANGYLLIGRTPTSVGSSSVGVASNVGDGRGREVGGER
jgi:hypothetical protein